MSDGEFLEEGEIESDPDDLSAGRTSVAPEVPQENGDNRGLAEGARCESKERSLQPGKRKRRRRHSPRERSSSKEHKEPRQLDPVEIAEMDEYEMLCIRGASPPHGVTSTSVGENFQRLLANQSSATYYEYERPHRYDSDDDKYSRRRSPPPKRRKDRGRRRQRQNRRTSPDRRRAHVRPNSGDEQDEKEGRKVEICKFYLLDCCVKQSICRYMHAEFPCKYFYLGLECQNEKPCKFLHGKALTEEMTQALARHVVAAPKAILGNFKRYSRDRALMMIEAKNRQLNTEEGFAGKNATVVANQPEKAQPSTPSESKLAQQPQDVSTIFSVQQMEKLATLGITDLRQVKQMSLAQLTDIGLSLSQIGEIQKTENDQSSLCKQSSRVADDGGEDVMLNASKDDMDMRKLLPSLPTINNHQDASNELKITREREIEFQNEPVNFNLMKNRELNQMDADSCLIHLINKPELPNDDPESETDEPDLDLDEPELVIDESVDETSDAIEDSTSAKTSNDPLTDEQSKWEPYFSETMCYKDDEEAKIDISTEDNDNASSISSEGALFDTISFDEPFETGDLCAEGIDDSKNNKTSKQSNNNNSFVLSDYDMRLPFADAIANFVPALEIDASLKSHLGIMYKLNEIVIPSHKDLAINPDNIPENTLDPRLKKLLPNKSKRSEEKCVGSRLAVNSPPSLVNPYKSDSQPSEISVDPRKRKDQSSEANTKPIQQNFNYVLNTFLQKSKWYQNLNSKSKIGINQLLADLSSELNKFSLNPCRDRRFQMSSTVNATQIQDILCEIGLEVNTDGILQEWKPPKSAESAEAGFSDRQEGFRNDIPSLLNMNVNQNVIPVAAPQFPHPQKPPRLPNIPIVLANLPRPRFEFPKPGLLGIAPGIEGPRPFLHAPNRMPAFNNRMNPQIWNDHPANYPMPPNFRQMCSSMDEMNRNQFPLPMGKRWNRNLNLKKPRRI